MKKPIFAANWKSNLDLAQIQHYIPWIQEIQTTEQLIFFSSHCYLSTLTPLNSDHIWIGAQDVSTKDRGAFTGEVAAFQLKSLGIAMTLVGHSERRHVFHESDEMLSQKLSRLMEQDIPVCFCIGETLDQRKAGKTLDVVDQQLKVFVDRFKSASVDSRFRQHALIAYEPVWAIGTGENAQTKDIESAHTHIHETLKKQVDTALPILYGGSVKPDNTYDTLRTPNVSGVLVGGASNQPETFERILKEAKRLA